MSQATRERERERERDEFELKNGLKLKNSIEIDRFVESLKDLKDNQNELTFYDYTQYDCEIARFLKAAAEKNIEQCLDFYREQEDNTFFEIKHPVRNAIKTRMIFSYLKEGPDVKDCYELLFFVDKNNQHPWILLSCNDTPMYAVVAEESGHKIIDLTYFMFSSGRVNMLSCLKYWLYLILNKQKLCFKDISWGYKLRNLAPLHYFYENLCSFLPLKTNKNIADVPGFFIPKKYSHKITNNEVYIIPKTLPYYIARKPFFEAFEMAEEVYNESMQDFNAIIEKEDTQYDLTIWLSLTATDWGKRWIEQVEGSVSIINELLKYFPKIKIYFDGLSGFENSNEKIPFGTQASEVEIKLLEALEKNSDTSRVSIKSLHKFTFRQKICYCSTADLCITETCSAAIVPSLCCKKPCVFFGNFAYLGATLLSNPTHYRQVDNQYIKLDPNRKYTHWDGFYPYHIPWQHIYNLAAEILEELSQDGKIKAHNLKMNRLQVPKVELIAKKYDLSLKLKEFEKLFHTKEELENRFLAFLANEFVDLEDKTSNLTQEKANLENALNEAKNTINSLPYKIQTQELNIKKLQVKELEKKLGLKLSKLEPKVVLNLNESLKTSAVARMRNHLAYKRGEAIIVCSKSFLGLLSLPFVIKFIENKHKKEQAALQKILKNNPNLKFVKFEACSDYEQALKLEQCFTYKLGLAFIKARKAWYKGGFVKFYFEAKRLYKEFKKQQKE